MVPQQSIAIGLRSVLIGSTSVAIGRNWLSRYGFAGTAKSHTRSTGIKIATSGDRDRRL